MPLGSSKFFSKNHTAGAGGQDPVEPANLVITSMTLTGQTDSALTVDANAVNVNFTINREDVSIGYEISGDISASDFTDNTLSGNITTVGNVGTLSKTITTTTAGSHKSFIVKFVRPLVRTEILATSDTVHIYEIIPATVTGGNTITTSNFVVADANGNNHIVAHKVHEFEQTFANSTVVISDKGNLEGNTTVWSTYLNSTSTNSYWNTTDTYSYGIGFRSLIIGGGGGGAGSGAGEMGVLKYSFYEVDTGSYIVQNGAKQGGSGYGDSYIFKGNASLQRYAIKGGAGGVSSVGNPGGSGGGQAQGTSQNYNGWANVDLDVGLGQGRGFTDLYDKQPTMPVYSDYVAWASGNNGGQNNNNGGAAGAGAFGRPSGAGGGVATGSYGFSIKLSGQSNGGSGISWPGLKDGNQTDIFGGGTYTQSFPHRWNDNPVYTGSSDTELNVGGGMGKAISGGGADGLGSTKWGADSDGVVTFSYPYVPARRFLSTTDLS